MEPMKNDDTISFVEYYVFYKFRDGRSIEKIAMDLHSTEAQVISIVLKVVLLLDKITKKILFEYLEYDAHDFYTNTLEVAIKRFFLMRKRKIGMEKLLYRQMRRNRIFLSYGKRKIKFIPTLHECFEKISVWCPKYKKKLDSLYKFIKVRLDTLDCEVTTSIYRFCLRRREFCFLKLDFGGVVRHINLTFLKCFELYITKVLLGLDNIEEIRCAKMIFIDKVSSCAITGHRPEKLPFSSDETSPEFQKLMNIIQQELLKLIQNGIITFWVGMARGIDIWTGEMIVRLKKDYPKLQLVGVIPFSGHDNSWPEQDRNRCKQLMGDCDAVITLNQQSLRNVYRKRNELLIELSDCLLAVVDSNQKRSGAVMTVNIAKAAKTGRIKINPITYEVVYEDMENIGGQYE